MRLARAYDEAPSDRGATRFKRLATAVGKYWICKRAPGHAVEALECLGGNGYVEESGMPRLYREAPLNSIWEGSGNVMCLDVLRALARDAARRSRCSSPRSSEAAGADARLDARVAAADAREFADPETLEARARRVVERMALALQGSLLVRHAPPAVADAFCASRLAGDGGLAFGTLPAGTDVERDRRAPRGARRRLDERLRAARRRHLPPCGACCAAGPPSSSRGSSGSASARARAGSSSCSS